MKLALCFKRAKKTVYIIQCPFDLIKDIEIKNEYFIVNNQ